MIVRDINGETYEVEMYYGSYAELNSDKVFVNRRQIINYGDYILTDKFGYAYHYTPEEFHSKFTEIGGF